MKPNIFKLTSSFIATRNSHNQLNQGNQDFKSSIGAVMEIIGSFGKKVYSDFVDLNPFK